MDTTTIVVLVLLLVALGIFIGVVVSGNSTGEAVSNYKPYPSQYGGGGCGR